ncbi:imelysin family protein [Enhygromyxa salina]|uniref:Iron-regulated protein A n=1 Tax=Enhygromyxa salina TaxID=215803 RepID=A0A2S9YNX8_9BACT|nr:imelysin family protein [Enhygromyxa salina]PRQ06790.1 Iron-regulated protein A precursor [Enhygromyxa salina]
MNDRSRSKSVLVGVVALVGLSFGALVACPANQEPDRRAELLASLVEAQFIPTLGEASERGEALHTAATALCSSPDAAHLDAAQDAWWQLRAPWKRALAIPLGPIIDDGFDMAIDFWPLRPSSVEGGVAAGVSSQAELDALGVASKGMPAVEYLLWDPLAGDEAVLAALTGADGPARCAYLELLTADVALRLAELDDAWRDDYATQLVGAGTSETYPDLALAIDAIVNAMIAGLHDLDDMKLAKPLGLTSASGADPELVESRISDRSLTDARDALAGFEAAYLGTDDGGLGLTILVEQRNPDVDAKIRAELEAAKLALAAVPEPLRLAISSDAAAVEQAQVAIKQVRISMTADVASLLGVTVSLSDNDGD